MILILDNYDSFTYNLYQMLGSITTDLKVVRNDAVTVADVEAMAPDGIVISPGPGRPEDAGICPEVIRSLRGTRPILGVCLGEQAIGLVYGAEIGYAERLMHGKQSLCRLDGSSLLFRGLPKEIQVARYHSLCIRPESVEGSGLRITGETDAHEVMAVEDRERQVYGVQFHPESIMTPEGGKILRNFIELAGGRS